MKVWITKYALTEGIFYVDAEISQTSGGTMVSYNGDDSKARYPQYAHGEGREWHRTVDSAVERAMKMRKSKIQSLRASLAKFNLMTEAYFRAQCAASQSQRRDEP